MAEPDMHAVDIKVLKDDIEYTQALLNVADLQVKQLTAKRAALREQLQATILAPYGLAIGDKLEPLPVFIDDIRTRRGWHPAWADNYARQPYLELQSAAATSVRVQIPREYGGESTGSVSFETAMAMKAAYDKSVRHVVVSGDGQRDDERGNGVSVTE